MHVIFTAVEMLPGTKEDDAVNDLKEQLIPQIKQAPGFIKGEWFGDEKNGHGFVVFETEDQAKQGLQQVGEVFLGVKVTRSDVYRLHAEA
jgi:quinol monooxygenase YgiN